MASAYAKRAIYLRAKANAESPVSMIKTPPPMEVSTMAIPPLLPYHYKRRGAFNFLRHVDHTAPIPRKPNVEKGSGSAGSKERAAATTDGSSTTEQKARELVVNPFLDFELWKAEYNGQLSLTDLKSMRSIIHKQEKQLPVPDNASISSDTVKEMLSYSPKTAMAPPKKPVVKKGK